MRRDLGSRRVEWLAVGRSVVPARSGGAAGRRAGLDDPTRPRSPSWCCSGCRVGGRSWSCVAMSAIERRRRPDSGAAHQSYRLTPLPQPWPRTIGGGCAASCHHDACVSSLSPTMRPRFGYLGSGSQRTTASWKTGPRQAPSMDMAGWAPLWRRSRSVKRQRILSDQGV